MFFIDLPASDDLSVGVACKINGHATTIKRTTNAKRAFLEYTDEVGKVNRCQILAEDLVDKIPMPDGTKVKGISFVCASDGQSPEECEVVRPKFTYKASEFFRGKWK
jgi:hypothetical protein